VIHVQVIGGSQADIYEIGKAMQQFKKVLPYRLEALVTNDKVELRDVDALVKELYKLKKQLETEKRLS
jgi:predicted nucleotidyltransferase